MHSCARGSSEPEMDLGIAMLTEFVRELGRALDVGEEEGDGSDREARMHVHLNGAATHASA